jgi:hypothetical protein
VEEQSMKTVDDKMKDQASLPRTPFAATAKQASCSGADRRRSERHPLGAHGLVVPDPRRPQVTDSSLQVIVMNVSLHGVGFRSPAEFLPGTYYGLKIGAGPINLSSTMQIVCSRRREDGLWDVGARFVGKPDPGPAAA